MMNVTKYKSMIVALLVTAGCATSDYLVPRAERSTWKPVKDTKLADAREVPPPKILPETHYAAGLLFEGQGHFEKAVIQYRKAIAVSHDYVDAYHRLGLVLSKIGRHAEAVEAFRRAVELRPAHMVYRNNLGFELMLQQRWSDAERELRKSIELAPKFERAYINLGVVLARQGKFTDALETFMRILPDSDAYYNLGLMYRGQKRYEDAAEAFRRVIQLDPQFTAAAAQLEQIAPFIEVPPVAATTVLAATNQGLSASLFDESAFFDDSDLTTVRYHDAVAGEPIVFDPYTASFSTPSDSMETLARFDRLEERSIVDLGPVSSFASDWNQVERKTIPAWDITISRDLLEDAIEREPLGTRSKSEEAEPVNSFTGTPYDDGGAVAPRPDRNAESTGAFGYFNSGFRTSPSVPSAESAVTTDGFSPDLIAVRAIAYNEMACWDELIIQNYRQREPNMSVHPEYRIGTAGFLDGETWFLGSAYDCPATQEEDTWTGDTVAPSRKTDSRTQTYGFPRGPQRE